MKVTAFQSDKGDCLLIESADGKNRMLVDGGMRPAYRQHVAPTLGALRKAKQKIDLVYISHIDQDHISGVLELLDNEAAWRVHEFHGNGSEPKMPRPPEIGRIFHNSFHDQIGKNSGAIKNMLAATSQILSGSDHPWLQEVAEERRELATSIPEALRVSRRIRQGQLNIPLNPEFDGKLMLVLEETPDIRVGSIHLKVIGPFQEDLKKLREDWNDWLRQNKERVKEINAQAKRDEDNLQTSDVSRVLAPFLRSADRLGEIELALAKELGNRKKVTAPNLASLMFLAEENGQSVLLTGDGHADDILAGLQHYDVFDAGDHFHVDLLKVQHHGSEHNIHKEFCDRVTADSYLFCGNGQHENPDLDAVELIFDRRMANDTRRFKFLFNSSSTASADEAGQAHMKKIESLVKKLAAKSAGRLTNRFISGSSMKVL